MRISCDWKRLRPDAGWLPPLLAHLYGEARAEQMLRVTGW
jgi:hypothetical protein